MPIMLLLCLGLGASAHLAMSGWVAPGIVIFWWRAWITALAASVLASRTNAHPLLCPLALSFMM
jgi:hypothetical protein